MALSSAVMPAISSLPIIIISYVLWKYFNSPLKKVPGPFLAKFSDLWRLIDVYEGRAELTHCMLHEKYGPAVRIGPNTVSLSEPELIPKIYSSRSEFLKSDFYTVNDSKAGKATIKTVFGVQSNEVHAQMLRPIQKFYNIKYILDLEERYNIAIEEFFKKIDARLWILAPSAKWQTGYCTFHGIRSMGFVAAGTDHTEFLRNSEKSLDYFAIVGQIPALDHWLGKNPVVPIGLITFDKAAEYSAEQVINRQKSTLDRPAGSRDMLDSFLEVKKASPEMMNDNAVIGIILTNVLAGADTTAISLRSVVYYTLKNPRVHRKLQRELEYIPRAASGTIKYTDAIKLPYLDAVIKEANRVHTGVGLLLERIVPEGGLTLSDGTFFPARTIVGINPWVSHRNKRVYGEDVGSFRPERWLRYEDEGETEAEFEARLSAMKKADLTFGAGKRVCLGKNISILALYKLTAALFSKYEMSLVHPEKEWNVQNSWFIRQTGMEVKIAKRA
ncbi:benzoate 4-monooxygenase cytochrome P450 protein [Rutstroemia sp. NJR-2017a WRK4]|nr:benzoate 4-monooxygenase cytochrome P450 protein [Rutstroemia sp. NJR-2017a WRK4]